MTSGPSCTRCAGIGALVGLVLGLVMGAGAVLWWNSGHVGRRVIVQAPPTVVHVPVVVYRTLKASAPLPERVAHAPAVQVIAERRIAHRLAAATINTQTGRGGLYVAPRPFISFRPTTRVAVLYGLLNGRPDGRLTATYRLARIGPVRAIASAAIDQLGYGFVGVGLQVRFN